MTWGLPIWIYLFVAGMAGGAYFVGFLAYRFTGNKQLFQLAVYLGFPLIAAGVILLILDLGSPLRFWHLLVQFRIGSPMSIGTWILIGWSVVAFAMMVVWVIEGDVGRNPELYPAGRGRRVRLVSRALTWAGLILSVFVMSYTGVLLAVSSRPLWAATPLVPVPRLCLPLLKNCQPKLGGQL